MNYHVDHNNKLIYFWFPKGGVTSIIEFIMYTQTGRDLSSSEDDSLTHSLYWNEFINRPSGSNPDLYSNYKSIIFTRTLHYRIVSCWYDKFIDVDSPTLNVCSNSNINTFTKFLQLLEDTYINRKYIQDVHFNHHFQKINTSSGFRFWNRINATPHHIFYLPEKYIPDGKLVQNHKHIKILLAHINKPELIYEDIQHMYHLSPEWQQKINKPTYYKDLTNASYWEIRKLLEQGERFDWSCFVNDDTIKIINKIYKQTIIFANKYNIPLCNDN